MTDKNKTIKCPQCSIPAERGTPNFPFCSERCRLLDLGAWASEKYRVAATETDEDGVPSLEEEPKHLKLIQ